MQLTKILRKALPYQVTIEYTEDVWRTVICGRGYDVLAILESRPSPVVKRRRLSAEQLNSWATQIDYLDERVDFWFYDDSSAPITVHRVNAYVKRLSEFGRWMKRNSFEPDASMSRYRYDDKRSSPP